MVLQSPQAGKRMGGQKAIIVMFVSICTVAVDCNSVLIDSNISHWLMIN